jgi:hypothetical protein
VTFNSETFLHISRANMACRFAISSLESPSVRRSEMSGENGAATKRRDCPPVWTGSQ